MAPPNRSSDTESAMQGKENRLIVARLVLVACVYVQIFVLSPRASISSSFSFPNEALSGLSINSDNTLAHTNQSSTTPTSITLLLQEIRQGKSLESIPTIPVVVWPYLHVEVNAYNLNSEARHIEENGITESPFLRMATDMFDMDPNVVWVGDAGGGPGNRFVWCTRFLKMVQQAKEIRASRGMSQEWPIFILDFSDLPREFRCKRIEREVGIHNVHYSRRSIVKNRHWDDKTEWISPGERINATSNVSYQHIPYFVRTDMVQAMEEALQRRNLSLNDPIEEIPKNLDVVHFWPHKGGGVHKGDSSQLRDQTSRIVSSLRHDNLTTFAGLKGDADDKGRTGVSASYVDTLLDSKIVVVAQRDNWEDHYRLFEALVSGSMVLMDRMLSLPSGLENGTSVVEFTSADDLRSKALYFLNNPEERIAIAKRGRQVAMSMHRTWHRMEEVIFGRPLMDCSSAKTDTKCPYIVHTVES